MRLFPDLNISYLKPAIDLAGKMKYAKGYYDSMYGRIESGWEIENEIIRYTFNIPGNTSALLYLPASSVKDVKENGKGILKKVLESSLSVKIMERLFWSWNRVVINLR